jgi:hypothetical protein
MAARSLMLVPLGLMLMGASCQTSGQRLDTAASTLGQTRAVAPKLDLPDTCTTHVERVDPKVGEKARWSQNRWEIVADARDRQADDCRAWEIDYNSRIGLIK